MQRPNLYQLFQASPELLFEDLSHRLRDMDERIQRLSGRIDDLAEAMENFIRHDLPAQRARPDVSAWTYHALMPNAVFDTVYEPEILPSSAKRWVKATGRLSARLVLARARQYHFEVQVADFVNPEVEASFALKVGGQPCPWLSREGRLFKALVPEEQDAATLDFALEVDPAAVGDHDVSFSFETIRVYANAAADDAPPDRRPATPDLQEPGC
ncbi:hypothetical protein [Neoroseomonas rubea]|uniref:hypothetical protein n=1 Tax=Neoroseomonas rubea TaxID=2748666 RepID=UPI0018E0556A|nr:hypothetical protein [Roseomonas rubea]